MSVQKQLSSGRPALLGIGGHFAGNADAGTAAVAPGAGHAEGALVASEVKLYNCSAVYPGKSLSVVYPCSLFFFFWGARKF